MKNIFLKRMLLASFLIVGFSCTQVPPEYQNKYAYRIDWNGEIFRQSQLEVAALPDFTVYCRPGGDDCYDMIHELQGYGTVTTNLRGFYDAYFADTLNSYFQFHKNMFKQSIPEISEKTSRAIDSLADGFFTVYVSNRDSSIAVFRDQEAGYKTSNLVFVLNRY